MIDTRFVYLAMFINLVGIAQYVYGSLRNEVRPHPVTWLLWALAPLVAFAGQASEGVGHAALLTLVAGICPCLVFLICLRRRQARWSVSAFDLACGGLSLVAVVLLAVYRQADRPDGLAIAADGLAAIPTYRKSVRDASSESWVPYGCLAASALLTLSTIRVWTFASAGFAIYLAVLGTSLSVIVALGSRPAVGPERDAFSLTRKRHHRMSATM
jgi:hypothetical protein